MARDRERGTLSQLPLWGICARTCMSKLHMCWKMICFWTSVLCAPLRQIDLTCKSSSSNKNESSSVQSSKWWHDLSPRLTDLGWRSTSTCWQFTTPFWSLPSRTMHVPDVSPRWFPMFKFFGAQWTWLPWTWMHHQQAAVHQLGIPISRTKIDQEVVS